MEQYYEVGTAKSVAAFEYSPRRPPPGEEIFRFQIKSCSLLTRTYSLLFDISSEHSRCQQSSIVVTPQVLSTVDGRNLLLTVIVDCADNVMVWRRSGKRRASPANTSFRCGDILFDEKTLENASPRKFKTNTTPQLSRHSLSCESCSHSSPLRVFVSSERYSTILWGLGFCRGLVWCRPNVRSRTENVGRRRRHRPRLWTRNDRRTGSYRWLRSTA